MNEESWFCFLSACSHIVKNQRKRQRDEWFAYRNVPTDRHFRGKWSDNFRPFLPFARNELFPARNQQRMTIVTIKSFAWCAIAVASIVLIFRSLSHGKKKRTFVQESLGRIHSAKWLKYKVANHNRVDEDTEYERRVRNKSFSWNRVLLEVVAGFKPSGRSRFCDKSAIFEKLWCARGSLHAYVRKNVVWNGSGSSSGGVAKITNSVH